MFSSGVVLQVYRERNNLKYQYVVFLFFHLLTALLRIMQYEHYQISLQRMQMKKRCSFLLPKGLEAHGAPSVHGVTYSYSCWFHESEPLVSSE